MKNRYIYFFAALAAAAALAVSCTNPLNPSPTDGDTGQVVLTVSTGEAGSARTILPAEPLSFSRYELTFTKGADTVQAADTSSIAGAGVSQELAAGTWTAAVNAYRMFTPTGGTETEYLAAQGSAPVTVSAGQVASVTVPIAPVPIGGAVKGIFTYTVSFPQGASGTLRIGDQSVDLTSGQTVSLELDPGYYDLVISLTNGDGKSAGAAQKVHIYSGLESKAVYTFIAEDFDIPGIFSDALNGTLLSLNEWTDGSITTAGQAHWYKITASSDASYYLQWDDSSNGAGDKTAYTLVSAYQSNGTPLFTNYLYGYDTPQPVNLSAEETIYVRVALYSGNSTGTYAIRYYDPAALPPQLAPGYVLAQGISDSMCIVTWNHVSASTGYKVYRSSSAGGTYTSVATISGEWTGYYTDTTVSEGITYYYKVSATNAYGEGPLSGEVSGTPPGTETGAPLTLNTWTDGNITTAGQADWYKITAESAGTYTIQWNNRDNSDKTLASTVSAYRSDGTPIFTGWSGYESHQSVVLSAGEIIYVRVAPQGNWDLGAYAIRYYNVPPETAPSYVGTLGIPGPACMVGVYWGSVTEAAGYKVYRSLSAGGTYSLLGTISGEETTSYTDTNVSAGTTYYYKVSATNAYGEGPLSDEASGTPPTPASLTLNTWATGNITTAGQFDWYQFTASTAATYYLQWDDSSEGTNVYSADIMVVAFRSLEDILFLQEDSGYSSPQPVSLSAGETVYVGIQGMDAGTYAIRYYD